MIEKELVKARFEKSFTDYDKNAIAQKLISDRMFEIFTQICPENYEKVFEIGCGTGLLTKKLANVQIGQLILNDVSEQVEGFYKDFDLKPIFLFGDAEKIDYPSDLDLIVSTSTVQWFEDIDNFLSKSHEALNSGGYLVFSTFLNENFKQIKDVFGVSLNYLSLEVLKALVCKKFELIFVEDESLTFYFKDIFDLLRHIKYTGTNALKKMNMTKSDLSFYANKYKQHATKKGLPLTYNPVYVVLKKVD